MSGNTNHSNEQELNDKTKLGNKEEVTGEVVELPVESIDSDANPLLLKHASHNLFHLYVSTLLLRSAFGTVMLLLPVYLNEVGKHGGPQYTKVEIGLIVGSYFIGEMTFVTIFGRLSDLMQKRRPFIVWGNIVAALSFAMFSLSNNFFVLFTAHIIEGIGAAMVIGPSLALIGDSTTYNQRGAKMGLFDTVTFGGMAVGFLLGGAVYSLLGGAEKYGHWSFTILASLLIFSAYYASKIIEPSTKNWREEWQIIKRFYRETINHKFNILGGVFVILFLWTMSAIQLTLAGSFDYVSMIQGEGLLPRFTMTLYAAAIIFLATGFIDWYFEVTFSTEEKQPLGGEEHSHVEEIMRAFKHKELRKILPAWLLVMTIIGTVTTYLPIILNQGVGSPGETSTPTDDTVAHGYNALEIGVIFVVGMILLGSMQYFFGKLADVWGRKPVLTIGLVSLVIMSVDVVYVVGFHPEYLRNFLSFPGIIYIIVGAIATLGVAAFGPAALAILSDSSDTNNRGMSGGIYSFMMGLGEITGDVVGGVFWDLGDKYLGPRGGSFAVLFFIMILSFMAFLTVYNLKDIYSALTGNNDKELEKTAT